MIQTQNPQKPRKNRISVCVTHIKGGFSLSSPLPATPLTAVTHTEIAFSPVKAELCAPNEDTTLAGVIETPFLPGDTIPPAHIRPESEWDDTDCAVHAAAHGQPMPAGWASIPGKELAFAMEWDQMIRDQWAKSGDMYRDLAALLNAIESRPDNCGLSDAAVAKLKAEVAQAAEVAA